MDRKGGAKGGRYHFGGVGAEEGEGEEAGVFFGQGGGEGGVGWGGGGHFGGVWVGVVFGGFGWVGF